MRKALGKKIKKVIDAEEPRFLEGARAQGLTEDQARSLWKLIEPFAGYSFNRAHAACYGLVAYQTGYLRANHPIEYMAALLTSVKDNPDRSPAYLAEARALNITVEPPDVNASETDFTPTPEGTIRYGLSAVRNVGESVVGQIIKARTQKGAFISFADFTRKVDHIVLNRRVVESLAKAGAFDSLKIDRTALLQRDAKKGVVLHEKVASIVDAAVADARAAEQGQFSLFAHDPAMQRDILSSHPDVAAGDATITDQTRGHELRGVDADGEADALGHGDDRGIHSDHVAAPVNERRVRIRAPDVVERTARDDPPVANQQSSVGFAAQRVAFAKGVGGRVKERGSKELRAAHRSATRSVRTRRTAKKMRSGVAGLSKVTTSPWPKAATASRSASRTEMANMSGGSPIALLPKTTSVCRASCSGSPEISGSTTFTISTRVFRTIASKTVTAHSTACRPRRS